MTKDSNSINGAKVKDYWLGHVNGVQYHIEKTAPQMVAFLMAFPMDNKVITTKFDDFILNTSMMFIDRCVDKDFLMNELLPLLIPVQMGEEEAEEFKPLLVRN